MKTLRVQASSIDGQGRPTIPAAVRAQLGAAAEASIEWTVLSSQLLSVNVRVQPTQTAVSLQSRDTGGLPR